MPAAQLKPKIVVHLAPETDPLSIRIGAAAKATLPFAFPDCDFVFVTEQTVDLQWSVTPIIATNKPGPTKSELEQVRAALKAIIASVRSQNSS